MTTELPEREALAERASRLGVRGELLLYGDGCGVASLELPSLEPAQQESVCSPRGSHSPNGELVAVCRSDDTEVFSSADGGLRSRVPGCAPSWRPDGTLTVSRNRQVVTDRGTLLIGRTELERAARRHPTVPDVPTRVRALVDGVAWLSNERAAVLLSIRLGGRLRGLGALSAIAFFKDGQLERTPMYLRMTGGKLAASPRGTYLTQTPDVILRGDGSQVSLPQHLRAAQAYAWSPDERFLAVADRFAVTVVDVASLERYDRVGSGLRSITLPVSALDLEWR